MGIEIAAILIATHSCSTHCFIMVIVSLAISIYFSRFSWIIKNGYKIKITQIGFDPISNFTYLC